MKKTLVFVLCSALSLSLAAPGYALENTIEKRSSKGHNVIVVGGKINSNTSSSSEKEDKKENEINKLMLNKSLELIEQMDKMAESEDYVSILSGSSKLAEKIFALGKGEYSKPKAVYKTVLPKANELNYLDEEIEISDELAELLGNRLINAIPSQITALKGAETLAAASVLSNGSPMILEGLENSELCIFIYDNVSVFVTFVPYEDDIAGVSANFVISDEIKAVKSTEELNNWFLDNMGLKLEFKSIK